MIFFVLYRLDLLIQCINIVTVLCYKSNNGLIKAEKRLEILDKFGAKQKDLFKSNGKNKFDKETLDIINYIKYDVSFYSRLAIVSFSWARLG